MQFKLAAKTAKYPDVLRERLSKQLASCGKCDNASPFHDESSTMKRFAFLFVLAFGMTPLAQSQVYFNSASAQPNNAQAAERDPDRRATARRTVQRTVRCRDGSRHTPRVCRRHGGLGR